MAEMPEILSHISLDGVNYALFRQSGQTWRLGAVNANWLDMLNSMTSQQIPAEWSGMDIFCQPARQKPPPLALMCCGLGSVWAGMGRGLYFEFPQARAAMNKIASFADWDVLGLMEEPEIARISQTRWQIPYLFMLEYAQWQIFSSLGLNPRIIFGHSLGELIALCLAGAYSLEGAWYLLETRAENMADLEAKGAGQTGMLAVPADFSEISPILAQWPDLRISNRNTEKQFILGGLREHLLEARRQLRKKRIPAIMLNMDLAFHNPAMRILRDLSMRRLNGLRMAPPNPDVISCVDALPYPPLQADICRRIADLDENTVDWVRLIEEVKTRYACVDFLELGPQETLCGITCDLLPKCQCLAADKKGHEALAMRTALARLFAMGFLDLDAIKAQAQKREAPYGQVKTLLANTQILDNREDGRLAQVDAEVKNIIISLIAEACQRNPEEITPEMELRHDLAIRSSHFPYLMLEAERRLKRPVAMENLFNILTVSDLILFLAGTAKTEDKHSGKGIRELFARQRAPLRRYVFKEDKLASAPFNPDLAGVAAAKCGNILTIVRDAELAEEIAGVFPFLGRPVYCEKPGAECAEAAVNADGVIIVLPPRDNAEGDADWEDGDLEKCLENLPPGREQMPWLCVLKRFIVNEADSAWQEMAASWLAKQSERLEKTGRPYRLIAWVEEKSDKAFTRNCADMLLMEALYGQHERVIWKRGQERLYASQSSLFTSMHYNPAQNNQKYATFSGDCHFSLFSQPWLADHGAHAEYTPLSQYFPPDPFMEAPWLAPSQILMVMHEAARLAAPWLAPTGFSDMHIYRLPSLPYAVTRECGVLTNSHLTLDLEGALARPCITRMSVADITANGRKNGVWLPMCEGRCLAAAKQAPLPAIWPPREREGMDEDFDLENFYDVLGMGKRWRFLGRIKKIKNDDVENHGAWESSITLSLKDFAIKLPEFAIYYLVDAAVQGAMASIAIINGKSASVSKALRSWLFSNIGFIRFDYNVFDAALPLTLQWTLSWQDDKLRRFDAQIMAGKALVLTIHGIGFDKFQENMAPAFYGADVERKR